MENHLINTNCGCCCWIRPNSSGSGNSNGNVGQNQLTVTNQQRAPITKQSQIVRFEVCIFLYSSLIIFIYFFSSRPKTIFISSHWKM